MKKIYVFTYGSLKKGYHNHQWMKDINAKFVGSGISNSEFELYSVDDSYPAIVKGHSRILGEVYQINASDVRHLDRLEGYPDLYNRRFCKVLLSNGSTVNALVYFMDNKNYIRRIQKRSRYIVNIGNNIFEWLNPYS